MNTNEHKFKIIWVHLGALEFIWFNLSTLLNYQTIKLSLPRNKHRDGSFSLRFIFWNSY
jgi:hypothetical protein